ncbi:hypothetical protein K435DRAFT_795531 [Dendrothele bispora CBS 962.96]|uniref:Uncharacterized protein n=1 Tax=Dendrothele bispora (strain CBS 962.96) TaxID=1314807 RepID=A0A4S8M890_DENBC|nr:hypothetical protein K435DRAFT_795531 [Dendrothele bispora CBS 962.96]
MIIDCNFHPEHIMIYQWVVPSGCSKSGEHHYQVQMSQPSSDFVGGDHEQDSTKRPSRIDTLASFDSDFAWHRGIYCESQDNFINGSKLETISHGYWKTPQIVTIQGYFAFATNAVLQFVDLNLPNVAFQTLASVSCQNAPCWTSVDNTAFVIRFLKTTVNKLCHRIDNDHIDQSRINAKTLRGSNQNIVGCAHGHATRLLLLLTEYKRKNYMSDSQIAE